MRKQAEHRFRAAASLARGRWVAPAALLMNAPALAVTAIAGWWALQADEPALEALCWILFTMALLWAVLVTLESWRVLRRYARRMAGRTAAER